MSRPAAARLGLAALGSLALAGALLAGGCRTAPRPPEGSAAGEPVPAAAASEQAAATEPQPVEPAAPGDPARGAEGALAAGDMAAARELSAQALLASPDDPELMLLRARVLDASGDWLSAQRLADAVSRACPEDPRGALLGARISLDRLGNASDALQRCVEALERMKGSVDLQELGGEALLALGRLEEARAVWSALVERDPGRTSAIKFLARESAAERLWDEAIGWLDRIPASEQGPDDLALAWQAAWELGERERGLATAQELAARRPGSEEAALMLARSLAAVGRTADALAEADRWLPAHAMPHAAATGAAAAGAPAADGESDARVTAGLFALRGALRAAAAAGDASATDAALADLRAALVADPDNLDALHAIASLLERSGDLRAALGYLKHVYELAPDGALHERVLGLESRLEGAK